MTQSVTVCAPATSANMGPGFDCLGIALDIWNTVTVELGRSGMEIRGLGAGELPTGPNNMIARCFRAVYTEVGRPAPDARIICENEIPLGRGMGSSSAAAVAGMVAANELMGRPLDQQRLLELAAQVEGHPDNSAAALLGGCRIVVQEGDHLLTAEVPIPADLRAVVFVPEVPMPTHQARALLAKEVSREDAVYNIGRAALLVNSLATGNLEHLAVATQDRLHQPARQAIFFPMKVIIRAALEAGALGAFLSGAGSSVLALARDREMTIGYEMAEAASKAGVEGDVRITQPTAKGTHVVG